MKIIHIPTPELISYDGASKNIGSIIKNKGFKSVFLVTDNFLSTSGLINDSVEDIKNNGLALCLFDGAIANPTIEVVEEGLKVFLKSKCDCIVAFGGGSPIDTAKAIGARASLPKKQIPKLKGNLKVNKKLPYLVAIPTTAGTGSEATLASVISNHLTHEKYPINDPHLVPKLAILDPILTLGLPQKMTSTTGMDALTHAVEAFIGKSNTKLTIDASLKAIRLIKDNLYECYIHPQNIKARTNMLKASFYAGIAFTRAYVGYVHSIAHTFGGFYNVPHGLANAVILPYVLASYGKAVHKKLAFLSDYISLTEKTKSNEFKANAFIEWIISMNKMMNIPSHFENVLQKNDLHLMILRAEKEGNPLYPVPKLFSYKDFEDIYLKVTKN